MTNEEIEMQKAHEEAMKAINAFNKEAKEAISLGKDILGMK